MLVLDIPPPYHSYESAPEGSTPLVLVTIGAICASYTRIIIK